MRGHLYSLLIRNALAAHGVLTGAGVSWGYINGVDDKTPEYAA